MKLPALATVLALTSACGSRDREVTWADVQPVLAASCLECHTRADDERRPGLATWEQASARAHEMLAMVEGGLMPPPGVDKSGACGDFTGPRPLDDDEVALLRAWVAAGAPEGTAVDSAPRTVARAVARDVATSVALAPSDDALGDRQRCVAVDTGADGAFLVGVRMDAPAAAHHAMVFTVDDDAALASEPWPCDGVPRALSGESGALAFAWVPGRDQVSFPEGTGVPLGARVIVQLHEHGVVAEGERATLTLSVAADVPRPLAIVPMALAGFALAPGLPAVSLARPVALPAGDVVGVMPHMHQAGVTLELRGDADSCVARVDGWDYAFQEVAFFARPLAVPEPATGTLTCTWDTSDRSTLTRWGEGSLDEMCTTFLFVAGR